MSGTGRNSANRKPLWRAAVGMGSCGMAAGAEALYERLCAAAPEFPVAPLKTGCAGMCYLEPMLELTAPDGSRFTYVKLKPADIERILKEHVAANAPPQELLVSGPAWSEGAARFLGKQKKIVLANCGRINPESLEEYQATGGYKALEKVLGSLSPQQVIEEILRSGLRGRGGAGFSTGMKWKFVAAEPGPEKHLICNADEGDPGAFMDRSVLESDPHRVLEGMAIGAYATGATRGYIYVRAEYPLAVKRLHTALDQAKTAGLLGKKILGADLDFDIVLREGAGAFVCGEETALIASLEGRRGMPRLRPPFPAQKGLWGKPTNINNVETWANVPWIILNGAESFAELGAGKSRGTKVFALAGKIKRGGLVEVPMGITLREVIEDIGGGSPDGRPVKAVQLGGPSGGCIPASLFDTPIDYEALTRTGAIMGSGGMVVMDETSCMVDIAGYFLEFTARESCGKCTFCRIGTMRMLEILRRIRRGEAAADDLARLEELAMKVKSASLCGLGQTAPNPVLTTLKYFHEEYEAHVRDRRCPARACKPLLHYSIDQAACTGCTLCAKKCPTGAISGERRKPHAIAEEKCVRCGACFEVCKFNAVRAE